MSNYENVRYSLDNILKELDDICRSIDDLTDIEPNTDADTEYYQKIIKNPSIHLSSLGIKSKINNKSLEPISSNRVSEIYYTVDDEEEANENHNDVYDRYNLSNFRQSKTFHETFNTLNLAPEIKIQETTNTNKFKTNLLNTLTDRLFNSNKSPFKKHRLPNDDSKGLNAVIGSVRDSFLFKKLNPLPLETKTNNNNSNHNNEFTDESNNSKNYSNLNDESNNERSEFDASRVKDSPKLKRSSKLISSLSLNSNNQVSFSMNNDSFEYGEEEFYLNSSANNNNNRKTPIRTINEDTDYLNPNEIAKIECFYNSMGCYVYVGKCIAELYQIKREDEFDAIDSDPVNAYKIYMENLNNKQSLISKAKINYTYINAGVPVIIFNYGANPKRDKDLRILLVERSTGFCMWEFKFDYLTQFDILNKMTIVRLTLNNNSLMLNNTESGSTQNNTSTNATNSSSSTTNNVTQSNPPTFNYQNEYFEKFFNSKNRHAHKEHLLKFVIKRDCNEFFFVLSRIMTDKRNGEMFVIKKETHEITDEDSGYFLPPLPMSTISSSLIVCYFDSNDPNRLLDSSQSSLVDSFVNNYDDNGLKSSIKSATINKKNTSLVNELNKFENIDYLASAFTVEFENDSMNTDDSNVPSSLNDSDTTTNSSGQTKYRKLRKSDISSPLSFNHVSHLDKPVAIGKRYKFNYS